jgi:uncharacterized membrane protein YhhN
VKCVLRRLVFEMCVTVKWGVTYFGGVLDIMAITATLDACSSGAATTAQRYALWCPVRHKREACVSVTRTASL